MFGKKTRKFIIYSKQQLSTLIIWMNLGTMHVQDAIRKWCWKTKELSAQNVATPMQIIVQGNILHSCWLLNTQATKILKLLYLFYWLMELI